MVLKLALNNDFHSVLSLLPPSPHSSGFFRRLDADRSTTTVWSKRLLASAYGPQFSILPYL